MVPEYYFDLQILSSGWTFLLGFRSTRPDLGEVLGISSAGRVHRLVFFILIMFLLAMVLNGCNSS